MPICLQNRGTAQPVLFNNGTTPPAGSVTSIVTQDPTTGQLSVSTPVASFATKAGVQQENYTYSADTGSANAYAVTQTPTPTIVAGSEIVFKAAHANTAASTITLTTTAGSQTFAITKNGTAALTGGEIQTNQIVTLIYDGAGMQMASPPAFSAIYHVVCFYPTKPNASPANQIMQWTCPADIPAGVSFAANFGGNARGFLQVNPTASAAISFYRVASGSGTGAGGTFFGTLTISTAGAFSWSSSAITFAPGDTMTAWGPSTQDATLSGLGFTLPGTR